MPTECERSLTSLQQTQQQPQQQHQQQQQQQQQYQQDQELKREQAQGEEEEEDEENDYEQTQDTMNDSIMEDCSKNDAINGEMSTSQTSTTSSNGINGSSTNGRKTSLTSPDPTAYVAKARVTRPTPPPPSYNPMQFVQIKPCNLYQTAQEQLKKAEEVKKIKEIKKEEPEDWQNNLDNWKSSRRKRVEHIIDRVVEVKKLELEEHDRSRRKSKTFSEMIEERGDRPPRGRAKLAPLAVYNEDESNDLSDLGIGTSSASGKSSISEDYDNNSVLSDNAELDKAIIEQNQSNKQNSTTREYISSPGYDTSSSTAPASSPDPCEYTYEGAIQDYKQRVSRATSVGSSSSNYKIPTSTSTVSTDSSPTTTSIVPSKVLAVENGTTANVNMPTTTYPTRRGSKIEDRLIGFEVTSPSDQNQEVIEKQKVDVPKVDISKRKEIFENQQANEPKPIMTTAATSNSGGVPKVVLRDRFKFEANGGASAVNNHNNVAPAKQEVKRLSGDVTTIRERLQNLEQQKNSVNQTSQATKSNDTTMKATTASKLVDVPVPPLKARLTSLQNAVTKEEYNRIKPPVALVDARQLEIMQHEDETAKQRLKLLQEQKDDTHKPLPVVEEQALNQTALMTSDRDDSGIHNRSAGDEDVAVVECIVEQFQSEQEQQLEAAIAALALEEKQLEEAANAVNQIEAEFAELTDLNPAPLPNTATVTSDAAATTTTTATTKITNQQPSPAPPLRDMEFSVSSTNNFLQDSSKNINRSCAGSSVASEVLGSLPNNSQSKNNVCNLRRKPSNEMVHARNLLKMFKETFKNDIELDESAEIEPQAVPMTKTPEIPTTSNCASPIETYEKRENSTVTQIFDFTKPQQKQYQQQSTIINVSPQHKPPTPTSPLPSARNTPPITSSMIPRAINSNNMNNNNPIGKPPMSPKSVRYTNTRLPTPQSPLCSPTPVRKSDGQFSINGRVEIFNSKHMEQSSLPPLPKPPTTPTMSTKQTHLSHLPTAVTHDELATDIILPTTTITTTQPLITALHEVSDPPPPPPQRTTASTLAIVSNQLTSIGKSMPAKTTVNEPFEIQALTASRHQQQEKQQPEVVICAPPVTIVNPDELPKPNTVKALSSCFSQDNGTATTFKAPMPPPKPLPRSRIPQTTPPQSPTPAKRHPMKPDLDVVDHAATTRQPTIDELKKLSIISNASTLSSDSTPGKPIETTAIVHSPPMEVRKAPHPLTPTKMLDIRKNMIENPLKPNDSLKANVTLASDMPKLLVCPPNESSLFKLASSTPSSPASPRSPTAADIALCSSFLTSHEPTSGPFRKQIKPPIDDIYDYQDQEIIVEVPCDKVDVRKLTPQDPQPSTFFREISEAEVKRCDGSPKLRIEPQQQQQKSTFDSAMDVIPSDTDIALCTSFLTSLAPTNLELTKPASNTKVERQQTIDEIPCDRIDIRKLPPAKPMPSTGFQEITEADVKRCDGLGAAAEPSSAVKTTNSKPNSPIMAARAAHSKALIETCEKIIAEERLASSQMKSTLPNSQKATPILQRKSKIPKPIPCCIAGSGSVSTADYQPTEQLANENVDTANAQKSDTLMDDEERIIARLHVVETQIKVTTTTPPASPKVVTKTQPKETKKTKNIFDFLRRNFGHHEGDTSSSTTPRSQPIEDKPIGDTIKVDEIHKVENSKFYIQSEDVPPPPLPKTPAPVNIEIKKTITTDEILEDGNSEMALSQEISDMLDVELDKLSFEPGSVDVVLASGHAK